MISPKLLLLTLSLLATPAFSQDPAPSNPDEIRRGIPLGGSPESRSRLAYERAIRRVEPSLKGDPARLSIYVEFFKKEYVEDPRTFAFSADATARPDGTILLTGYSEYAELPKSLEQFLAYLGFSKIQNDIEPLPSKSLGDKPFAIVQVPHTTLYDKTTKPRENVSTALLGDPLFLLKKTDDDHYLVHSAEGYLGYVAAADVQPLTAGDFAQSQSLPRATLTVSAKGGDPDTLKFPAGAHLHVLSSTDKLVTLATPSGKPFVVPNTPAVVTVTDEAAAAARVAPVIAAAKTFMGTKYVWGGKSLDGIDCSGLVQTSYQTTGLRLARDADQQSLAGQLVATRWYRDGLRPGDTLYFLSRRGTIHHTALFIGDHQYIEAAGAGVKITSLDPKAPNYDPKRDESFCFAKRLLD